MTVPTPLEPAPPALAPGRAVLLKREDAHELGAFKWRGALPVLEEYRRRGARVVVTASTGNHGAAVAWAAGLLGLEAAVFAPAEASPRKLALLEELGADVRLGGADFDEAKGLARAYAAKRRLPFFEDGAEPGQLRGYAAIADELLDQAGGPPAAVVVPVGNGALLAGIGGRLARRAPGTLRIGVVPKEAPVMALSFAAGHPVECDRCATVADGLAVRVAIPFAVAALARAADRLLLVSERAIAGSVAACDAAGVRAEPSATAAHAALPQLQDTAGPVVLVLTGRNLDGGLLARAREHPESFPD